jgi:hypothetical protein
MIPIRMKQTVVVTVSSILVHTIYYVEIYMPKNSPTLSNFRNSTIKYERDYVIISVGEHLYIRFIGSI